MSNLRQSALLLVAAILPACSSGGSDPATPPATCNPACVAPDVCDPNLLKCVPPSQVTCPQACPAGTTCDAATKQCVPTAQGCNPPCTAPDVCDQTTKTCVPSSGRDCSPPCGANSFCTVQKICQCNGSYMDCNNNVDQGTGADGCECKGTCEGAQCKGEISTGGCRPEVLNDCGDATRYCNVDTCEACPDNKYNCDGHQDCEAEFDCARDGCELFGSKTCVSQGQFCDQASKTCAACPAGTFNCDRAAGTCECTTSCDGSNCKDECTSATGCGDTGQWCDFGVCKPCVGGRFNCDGPGNCECDTAGCSGTTCVGERACDYYDANGCNDNTKWCYQNVCQDCSSGFNCNGTKGCECDGAGCNGDQCAGKCSGGEC